MATIHDEIDSWLAADIHGELSEDERQKKRFRKTAF